VRTCVPAVTVYDAPLSVNTEFEPVGERLRTTREKAGLSLSDVVHQTRIPNSVIVALEAGDFSAFDSPTYAKSFLSQYGVFLEVDTSPWLDAIEPADYIPVNVMQKFVEPVEAKSAPAVQPVTATPSVWSASFVLLLSCAILGGALYGYFEMEKRFSAKRVITPATSATNQASVTEIPEQTPSENPDENEQLPPPRAIIVRE